MSKTEKAVVRAAMRMLTVFGAKHVKTLKGNRGLLVKMLRACARHAAAKRRKSK